MLISGFYMMNTDAKANIREAVHAKVKTGKCLIDGCDSDATRRGLCVRHYHQFNRQLRDRPKADRPRFMEEAIKNGLVLAPNKVREIKSTNPFADL